MTLTYRLTQLASSGISPFLNTRESRHVVVPFIGTFNIAAAYIFARRAWLVSQGRVKCLKLDAVCSEE